MNIGDESDSVAVHPNGLQVGVGTASKLRLYTVVKDDLLEECEIPVRSCTELRYSHGGHVIAAVSGTAINIFSSVTYALVTSLRGQQLYVSTRTDM